MGNSTNAVHTWLKATCGEDSYREIARRANLSDSIISRQIRVDGKLSSDVAISIARAYNAPVLGALIANGRIEIAEAGINSIESALSNATDEQLVREIAHRLDVATNSDVFDRPISEVAAQSDNITHLRLSVPTPEHDQDEKAAASDRENTRADDRTDGGFDG